MSPDWLTANNCFTDEATKLGAVPTVVGPNQFDVAAMINFMEQAIAQQPDGIAVWAGDDSFKPVLEQAKAAGIPVVYMQSGPDPSLAIAQVWSDLKVMSADAAKQVIEKSGGKANVGIITTGPGHADQIAQIDTFKAAIEGSGVKVVDVQYDNSDVAKATEVTTAMLQAHPGIDYIWTVEGAAPAGVATALKELGLVGKVNVLGIDLHPTTRELIEDGTIWATYTQGFCAWGQKGADLLIDAASGKPNPSEFVIDTGTNFITKDTLPPA
jgi:ribose transport system substrate-binding protein